MSCCHFASAYFSAALTSNLDELPAMNQNCRSKARPLDTFITVTLPDFSQCQYQYEHYTFTSTNNSIVSTNIDSDHLMLQEIKPNGRIVANLYDSLRRVTTQASTVGTNLVLVTNAFFFYTQRHQPH